MTHYADIILPLALAKRTYTYAIPEGMESLLQTGLRVEVQFGKSKLYSGLVERVHTEKPDYQVKSVIAVLDEVAVVTASQLKLWDWIADYYCCTLGEVMSAALPGHLRLSSETKIVYNDAYGEDFSDLGADEYLVAEGLLIQKEITVDDARKILNKKTVFPVIQRLLTKGVLFLRESLQEKFKPKRVSAVRLAPSYQNDASLLKDLMPELAKKERQLEILMAYLTLAKQQPFILKQELLFKADVSESSLKTLVKKGVLEIYDREVSRMSGYEDEHLQADVLSDQQVKALADIRQAFSGENEPILLHGVTGSGKTRVYIELIQETIKNGGQVLYLLPEIALTTQIIQRLQRVFGSEVAVYHSRVNTQERVEVWRAALEGKPVILAARSGLFLPFRNLKLIIVDEEHDPSYKQYDPAPRYNARDTAIYLAHSSGAHILLGTATPSIESWYNATQGKYKLVEMPQRFGGLELPEAILFQNRRGYAPMLECQVCGWNAMCRHCDVSLTYHKHTNRLRCHYCGYVQDPAVTCPACSSGKITLRGFGTEKIEDELKIFMPNARIRRLDMDTAGSKNNLAALLNDFEEHRLDILVGTQMVTKGLDFDNVGIVGVLGADQLTKFPDFRAGERAFQLLTQVAGRAGRKYKRGKVLIQAYDTTHPVIQEVLNNDFLKFAARELKERHDFHYPPYYRLIAIQLRHKEPKIVYEAAAQFGKTLRAKLGARVLGPVLPNIPRIRGQFGQDILLKLEKSPTILSGTKQLIRTSVELLVGKPGFSQVQVVVDVDPM
jgi:primosomal protein N' (replication factor Y) (superfamily II helicase)